MQIGTWYLLAELTVGPDRRQIKGAHMGTVGDLPSVLQKALLVCGILAAFLYGGTDILAGLLRTGYRFDSQSASILSASGTATRLFVLPLLLVADLLLAAFAIGVWFSAGRTWGLRVIE
jgi:hypothetical protein